jgi:quinol monooxygenase YgiN
VIVVSGVIELDETRVPGFLEAVALLVAATLEEPGCLSYQFWRHIDRAGVFHVFEEWADEESLAAHGASAHYRTFASAMRDFGVSRVSIDRYDGSTKSPMR